MRYDTSITIDLPHERVTALIFDLDNVYKWQRGLLGFEQISGEPGADGAKWRVRYQWGSREVEYIETVIRYDPPDVFDGSYDGNGMHSIVRNRFSAVGPDQTLWEIYSEFRFQHWAMRLLAFLVPAVFKARSRKQAEDFKAFAERGIDVRTAGN